MLIVAHLHILPFSFLQVEPEWNTVCLSTKCVFVASRLSPMPLYSCTPFFTSLFHVMKPNRGKVFGYGFDNSDLTCEDFRSRANFWVQSKHALDFFYDNDVPFQDMVNDNSRVTNDNWCLRTNTLDNPTIVVYLRQGGSASIDLSGVTAAGSSLSAQWYDPRKGGDLLSTSVSVLPLPDGSVSLGNAPSDNNQDWLVLIR